jgi:hypothetical protein
MTVAGARKRVNGSGTDRAAASFPSAAAPVAGFAIQKLLTAKSAKKGREGRKEKQRQSVTAPLNFTVKSTVRRTDGFDPSVPAGTPQEEGLCQQDLW